MRSNRSSMRRARRWQIARELERVLRFTRASQSCNAATRPSFPRLRRVRRSALPPPMRCRVSTPIGQGFVDRRQRKRDPGERFRRVRRREARRKPTRRAARRGGRPSAGLLRAPARGASTCRCALAGTPFRVAVWRAVAALSFGEFVSYADVARAIGRPRAHRGVAAAMVSDAARSLRAGAPRLGADGRDQGRDAPDRCAHGSSHSSALTLPTRAA